MTRLFALLTAAALLAGCAGGPPPARAPAFADAGQAFAQRACAGCHSIGRTGASPNARAPAFRDLGARLSDAELARALNEISRNGHVEMPPIYVTPDEMKGVVAYIRGLTSRAT